eukprot:TRINITY_DN16201_c0_g1_i2.p1 TRINITY_DN16201_c0_g1~~TRINITY_DN16201_c0_g1_i2.p1  ORF type:complete len:443 (-),score=77.37 TRINITY_DN16201_c0_g1_i2:233-1435(-)
MLRSLVGSEMCIRDRYQRRVRGTPTFCVMAKRSRAAPALPPPGMRVLVTGGSGFFGQHTVHHILRCWAGCVVACTYSSKPRLTSPMVQLFKMDLQAKESVEACVKEFRPNMVIHLAGVRGLKDVELSRSINLDGLVLLLDVLDAELGIGKYQFSYPSTDLVYGSSESELYESGPRASDLAPIGIYAEEKLMAERVLLDKQALGLNLVLVRGSFIYGWNLYHDTTYDNNFFIQLVGRLSRGQAPTLFLDEWRTPVYVDDAVNIMTTASLKFFMDPCAAGSRIFNLTSGELITRYEFGLEVCHVFGFDKNLIQAKTLHTDPELQPLALSRPRKLHLSDALVRHELGLELHGVRSALEALHEMQENLQCDGYFHVTSPKRPKQPSAHLPPDLSLLTPSNKSQG